MMSIESVRRISGWFGRAPGGATQAPSSPTRPTAASRPVRQSVDRSELSPRQPSRRAVLRDVRSSVGGFFNSLGAGVERLGRGGSRLVQDISDFAGDRLGEATTLTGRVASVVTTTGAGAAAELLELQGSPQAADRLRRAGRAAGSVLDQTNQRVADMTSNFVSGAGDGAGALVEGIGTAIANPVQTLEGVNRLNQLVNPVAQAAEVARGRSPGDVLNQNFQTVSGIVDGFREDYRQTGRDHGTEGQVGRAAFDILSTVLTGGESAVGRVGVRAATNSLDDFARASRAVRSGETVVQGSRSARLGSLSGRVLPGRMGDRLTRAAEGLRDAGVARSERQLARTRARGEERLARGEVPGADGAEMLSAVRERADALRNELPETRTRWEGGGSQREGLFDQLPSDSQQRVRRLEAEGRADEALEVVQRYQVEQSIRNSLDDLARVDQLYPTVLPGDVDPSRVLARGRRESLEYLLGDPTVSSDALRRNFRHVAKDSDVTGPVFIQEFRAGDSVGRAFSTSAGRQSGVVSQSSMTGGYFGEAADASLSRSQVQARNALGLDNHADQFATFTIPEDTYAVVSQIGEQFRDYGGHAVGGNRQFTFPGQVQPVDPRVTDVGRLSRGAQRGLNTTVGTSVAGSFGEDVSS